MADVKALEIYSIILRYINAVRQYFEIDSVFLFGSYAACSTSHDSDIDILERFLRGFSNILPTILPPSITSPPLIFFLYLPRKKSLAINRI